MTKIDNEVEYNNRARVPEHPAIGTRWAAAARDYRARARAELDLSYGPGARQRCDLYHPPGGMGPATPLVVYIHGGYWQRGERQEYAHVAAALFNEMGIAVALPSYDLCPAVRVADIVGQMRAAMIMLWRHTKRRPVVTGHSAGGHLTAAMLATDWTKVPGSDGVPADLVRAGVAISGVFEVEPLVGTSLNEALRLTPEDARAVSNLQAKLPRKDVTLVAAVGGAESSEFLRQSRDVAAAWAAQGARTEYLELPGANHFTVVDELARAGSPLVTRIAALAREHSVV
jgi:arylformamidase